MDKNLVFITYYKQYLCLRAEEFVIMLAWIKNHKSLFSEIISVIFGSAIFGGGIAMFLTPGDIVLGGATGLATTIHILTDLPVGTMMFCINVPLILIGLKVFGFKFLYKTIICSATTSLFADLLVFLPVTIVDPLLCSLIGSATLGAGAGILLSRGYNTGGSDLAAIMLKTKYKRLSTGRLIFIIDIFIILGSAIITKNYAGVLYSVIGTLAYSFALDHIIDGTKTAKMVLVISDKYEEISNAIFEEINRGVTILHGLGWYSHKDKHVILCVVKRDQIFAAKTVVNRVDPNAFMILTDAREVLGSGFAAIE